jgi:hypothetical protein
MLNEFKHIMKRAILGLAALLSLLITGITSAQGTAFTYQGRLNHGAGPAMGIYDLRFAIYDAATNGAQQGVLLTNSATAVSNGLFTVTLDFGNQFPGAERWLEIAARTNGAGTFAVLSPRQRLAPTPYAMRANTAASAASVAAGNIAGTLSLGQLPASLITNGASGLTLAGAFAGNGSGLSNLNASMLATGTVADARLSTNVALRSGGNTFSGSQFITNGNVGILTTSPLRPLQIGGPPDTEAMMRFYSTSSNGVASRIWEIGVPKNDTNVDGKYYSFVIDDPGVGVDPEFMVQWGSGNIGIGTLSPQAKLDVNGSILAVSFSGSGSGLTEVDASQLLGPVPSASLNNAWKIGGNAGTIGGVDFLGTTDSQPLDLRVNNQRGLRLEFLQDTNALQFINVIAGSSANSIASGSEGSTIAGGGAHVAGNTIAPNSPASTIGGGVNNHIYPRSLGSSISGGIANFIDSDCSEATIAGGHINIAGTNSSYATISGGNINRVQGLWTVVGGGYANVATNDAAAVGGGYQNAAGGNGASVGGGVNNVATGYRSTVSGGDENRAQANWATIGGGVQNQIGNNNTAPTIGGGYGNVIEAPGLAGTIAGGYLSTIAAYADQNTIGGGAYNLIGNFAWGNTIAGGYRNRSDAEPTMTTIGGGQSNSVVGLFATVPGGLMNSAGNYSFAAGRNAKANHQGSFVWADAIDANFFSTAQNQFNVRANGGVRFVTGGAGMTIDGAQTANSFSGSGANLTSLNASQLTSGTVSDARLSANVALRNGGNLFTGGTQIFSNGQVYVMGPLRATTNVSIGNFVFGPSAYPLGFQNLLGDKICLYNDTIESVNANHYGFGIAPSLLQIHSDVAGSDIAFGYGTSANFTEQMRIKGNGKVGIGNASPVKTLHVGDLLAPGSEGMIELSSRAPLSGAARSFQIGVPQTGDNAIGIGYSFNIHDTGMTYPSQFLIQWDSGFVGIANTNPIALLTVGNAPSPAYCNGVTWVNGSDRNAKESFADIDSTDVLARVVALPMQSWSYKAQPGEKHIGPMAQDFHRAFGLNGSDDKHIATVDADGIALAAIQGLNRKLEEKLAGKESEINDLKARLSRLERLIEAAR